MSVSYVIALNTYRELVRDRVLYGLIVFAVLFIGLSLLLGNLTFDESTRLSTNFGLAAIHICSAILSIFVGSTLVYREIEKKTVLTLLARPITRPQFLFGKSIGLLALNLTMIFGLAAILVGVLTMMDVPLSLNLAAALWGIFIESCILLYFTILFGLITRPLLAVSFSIGVFLIGHWMDSLKHFASKYETAFTSGMYQVFSSILPNLERFNWRSAVLDQGVLSFSEVGLATLYALFWSIFLLALANLIFWRRDFE